MNVLKILVFVGAALFLAACRSLYEPEPVNVGPDPSQLKKSPCACLNVPMKKGIPSWMQTAKG